MRYISDRLLADVRKSLSHHREIKNVFFFEPNRKNAARSV